MNKGNKMPIYNKLSKELENKIIEDRKNGFMNPYRCNDESAVRRDMKRDKANLWRPAFVRDCEKIMHLPLYNRYADKTQVFSFYNNDDITRRALHVQLVSRIARNIGAVLGLNLDLIEAIALGHDIGHTPFGHAGESYLSELLYNETNTYFNHNVQSFRVLDRMFARNLTFQVLDGIVGHNGEIESKEYFPNYGKTFDMLDSEVADTYIYGTPAIKKITPSTLEGCVVRICDMIAYLGKDRQDAEIAHIIDEKYQFKTNLIGSENAKIINNLTVDIIENSYGKDHIELSKAAFEDLKTAKRENYVVIYKNERIEKEYQSTIKPMFADVYYKLLDDLKKKNTDSLIYKHHIYFMENQNRYYDGEYAVNEPNQVVVDYIAGMTDDYFIALHKHLFPNSKYSIEYKSYFNEEP